MDCRNFRERLSEFLDRQLAGPEQAQAERHVLDCRGCRSEFEELKGISKMISGVERKPLPVGFMQRLERRRAAEGEGSPAPSYSFLPPGLPRIAAFALSSLIVAMVVVNKTSTLTQPSTNLIGSAEKQERAAPKSSLSAGGLRGLGAISGGGGGSFASADSLKMVAGNKALDSKRDDNAGGAGESVNMETLAMLQKAASAELQTAVRTRRAAAKKALPEFEAKANAAAEPQGSVTSTGQKLARARGEPFGAAAQAAPAIANAPAAAPAAPAAPPARQYTNEELASAIEAQKAKMRIIPPGAQQSGLELAMLRGAANARQIQLLQEGAPPTPLSGDTPALLGAGGGGAAPLDKDARLDETPGVLIRSEAERSDLWHKYEIAAGAPKVDYATQMLAVVFATSPSTSIQISRVTPSEDKITIYFHEVPIPAGSSLPPYQFRVIPKTDKPVDFEKLP